jgi:hypothetical protein
MADDGVGDRDLSRCYGRHREQTLDYALKHCLQCRKLKTCVRKTWGTDRHRRWQQDDWWEALPATTSGRRPPWPSQPPLQG